MVQLTLADVLLVLRDLTGVKEALLAKVSTGAAYLPKLRKALAEIEALPPALTGGRPVAQELDATDAEHDGYGAALWHITEAYLRLPASDEATREAARRIRAAFIPEMKELQRAYPAEAAAAVARQADISRLQAELERFPVQGAATLKAWAEAFIGRGLRIEELIRQRGDATAERESRARAAKLRSSTLGLLGRLREAVRDEVEGDDRFEPGFEASIFALHDELKRQREDRAKPAASPDATQAPA